ncbi:DUF1543 domain-containing protein [Fusibacter bizertensis]
MQLFMMSLGGKIQGANIEVHDVQFAVAERIEDTYDLVRSNWYGIKEKLHMDAYTEIKGADGYRIELIKEKPMVSESIESDSTETVEKLYFVYMGGYSIGKTQELHDVGLYVASSQNVAKSKASKDTRRFEKEGHIDSVVEVESCLLTANGDKYYIVLEKTDENFEIKPEWLGYKRLDV